LNGQESHSLAEVGDLCLELSLLEDPVDVCPRVLRRRSAHCEVKPSSLYSLFKTFFLKFEFSDVYLENGVDLAAVARLDGADRQVGLDAASFVEAAGVDGSADRPLRVGREEPIGGQLRLGPAQVQLAEVRHVEHGHLVAARAALLSNL